MPHGVLRLQKQYAALPGRTKPQIAEHLRASAVDPRPPGSVSLKGELKGSRRVRVSDDRIGYQMDDQQRQVPLR